MAEPISKAVVIEAVQVFLVDLNLTRRFSSGALLSNVKPRWTGLITGWVTIWKSLCYAPREVWLVLWLSIVPSPQWSLCGG